MDIAAPTDDSLQVPAGVNYWVLVPLIDMTAGFYNLYFFYDTEYSSRFAGLEIVDVLQGLVGLTAWFAGARKHTWLEFFEKYSKVAISWQLLAFWLEYQVIEDVLSGSHYDNGLVGYGLHFLALAIAGATVLPVGVFVEDAAAWVAAHPEIEETSTESITDTYETQL